MGKQVGRKTRFLLGAYVTETINVNVIDAAKSTSYFEGMPKKWEVFTRGTVLILEILNSDSQDVG
jgi:hypothetical protein